MSKHKNYNKMYEREERTEPAVTVEETATNPVVETEVTPVHVEEPKFVTGIVTGCAKLNIREHPSTDAEVLCVLPLASEVQVDSENDYEDWYHVVTAAGREGYCMKQFIKLT